MPLEVFFFLLFASLLFFFLHTRTLARSSIEPWPDRPPRQRCRSACTSWLGLAAVFAATAAGQAGQARAGVFDEYLEKSKANKELNDKKRLATSGANFARAYTVEFGSCQFPCEVTEASTSSNNRALLLVAVPHTAALRHLVILVVNRVSALSLTRSSWICLLAVAACRSRSPPPRALPLPASTGAPAPAPYLMRARPSQPRLLRHRRRLGPAAGHSRAWRRRQRRLFPLSFSSSTARLPVARWRGTRRHWPMRRSARGTLSRAARHALALLVSDAAAVDIAEEEEEERKRGYVRLPSGHMGKLVF
uniref:Cathepsin propeptide inhibitor domain-containing protein n=1 Tax=Oryza meridionalis TaxID=40149 RepID=A0A0E0CZV6_9ORYZ